MNKTIFITGAAKRIGKEIALTFKELGWNIIIHYNSSKEAADDLAAEINNSNANSAVTVQGNLDVKEDVEKIISEVLDAFPSIDLLINNASTFYPTPIDDISEDHWEKLIGSNLKGPMFLIKGLKQKLKESNGSIINITDTNLSKGVANYSILSSYFYGLFLCKRFYNITFWITLISLFALLDSFDYRSAKPIKYSILYIFG